MKTYGEYFKPLLNLSPCGRGPKRSEGVRGTKNPCFKMVPYATLVIGDNCSTYFDHKGVCHILVGPSDLPDTLPTRINVYVNTSDMDVAKIHMPSMGSWDSWRFSKLREKNQKSSLWTGFKVHKDCLVEVSCPPMNDWVEELLARQCQIQNIKPMIISPNLMNHDKLMLVISDHGINGYRQTAFLDGQPIFTRMTCGGVLVDDILATLTYLKNQFHMHESLIQCHLTKQNFEGLESIASNEITLQLQPLLDGENGDQLALRLFITPFSFMMPESVNAFIKTKKFKILNKVGLAAASLLFTTSGWQFYEYSKDREVLESKQAEASHLQTQANVVQASMPIETLLPETYKKHLNETSPISIFQIINQALTGNITLSALKWENLPTEERILLEVKIVNHDDDADQNVDAIEDFKVNLQEMLLEYQVETQSMPNGSCELETFSGTTKGQDLTLAGDRSKAIIQLTRKKLS